MGTAEADLLTEFLDVEVGIVEVVVDFLHDFVDKSFVVSFQNGGVYIAVLLLDAGEFSFETQTVVDETVDKGEEFVDVEWFADVTVCTFVPSGHSVGHVVF